MFVPQAHFLRNRNPSRVAHDGVACQFRLLGRGESALDDGIAIVKRHLAGGDLRGSSLVDLVTDDQDSEQTILRGWTEIDGLEKNFVEMSIAEPPGVRAV